MIAQSMTSRTWTEYLKNSKLYGVGKECPPDWALLVNTDLIGTEKCFFEKCVACFEYSALYPKSKDDGLVYTIFQLTCFYIREHDNIEFEHIHRHVGMYYSVNVDGLVINLTSADGSYDNFKARAILIEPYNGKEDDISIEYYPKQNRYHTHLSIADSGIKYSMSFDSIKYEA